MVHLTQTEKETLLILCKDITSFYNANSLSKILGISHVGTQKILKKLLKENLLVDKKIGKSIIYKPNFNNEYVEKLIVFLLIDEANNFKRWKEEWREFFKEGRIIIMFGSAIKDYTKAKDIDLMIVIKENEKDIKEINALVKEKEKKLPKKLHAIKLTKQDFIKNIKKKDKILLDIIKNSIVLHGQDIFVEIIKNVTSF